MGQTNSTEVVVQKYTQKELLEYSKVNQLDKKEDSRKKINYLKVDNLLQNN